jgi:hypothetical protein
LPKLRRNSSRIFSAEGAIKYSISFSHEGTGTPDITIEPGGKLIRHRPTMVQETISIVAPGLEVDRHQFLALYKLIKGYTGLTYHGKTGGCSTHLSRL